MEPDAPGPRLRRAAGHVVVAVGLYQGAVPLVVRGLFGGDQRFAPALWLRAPWWWIACLAVVAATVALAAWLEPSAEPQDRGPEPEPQDGGPEPEPQDGGPEPEPQQGGPEPEPQQGGPEPEPRDGGRDGGQGDPTGAGPRIPVAAYDALNAAVFLLALYNGVAPFVARLVFDGDLLLSLTLRLPAPWWWIASLAVLVVGVAVLEAIDRAKHRRLAAEAAEPQSPAADPNHAPAPAPPRPAEPQGSGADPGSSTTSPSASDPPATST